MAYDFDVVELNWDFKIGPLEAGPVMKNTGWVGGQWVTLVVATSRQDANSIIVSRKVEKGTDLNSIGFILRGSLEGTDQYTSFNPGVTGAVTLCQQGLFLFKYYENVPYTLNSILYVSPNGLLTSVQTVPTSRSVGFCVGIPADNNNYLGASIVFP
jgi:hypothetical protein